MLAGAWDTCHACGASVEAGGATCPSCQAPLGVEPTAVRKALTDGEAPAGPLLAGKWRLGAQLGKGGMGAVYLAHDEELDRPVAIKMLGENLCDDVALVQRFEREARMMARLDHPNLVPVYAVGLHGNTPFIVMKRLEGFTLGDVMAQRGRFQFEEALAITRQICAGLQFIHDRNVVHRDVKPANIFLAPDGHVTLLDLGVARESTSSMTRSGVLVGTPLYMAPEQVLATKVDHRTDLYALAAVLYEMLTGRAVFLSTNDFSVMRAHIDQAPTNPQELTPMPQGVAAALLKGLAKSPDERFQSAKEFLEALERSAATVSSAAPTEPALRGISEPLVKGPAPSAAETARTVISGASLRLDPGPVERPSESAVVRAAVRQRPRWLWVSLGVIAVAAAGGGYAFVASDAPTPRVGVAPVTPPPPADLVARPAPQAPEVSPIPVDAHDPRPADGPHVDPRPELKPIAAPDPKPAVAAKSGPAQLRCITTVGGESASAYVDVDGFRIGPTPLVLKLEPGTHELVFRRGGSATLTRRVTVGAGEVRKLTLEMTP